MLRFTRFKLIAVIAVGILSSLIAGRAQAAGVVLSNLPGTGTYNSTGGIALTTINWAAIGLTTGNAAEGFVSLRGEYTAVGGGTLEGGIYSNNAGNPGSLLAAFSNVAIASSSTAAYTVATSSPFNLQASTAYWFVLHDALAYSWDKDNSTNGTSPIASSGYAFNGYRISNNTGGAWSTPAASNWTAEITTSALPEPASLGVIALAGVMALGRRRRL